MSRMEIKLLMGKSQGMLLFEKDKRQKAFWLKWNILHIRKMCKTMVRVTGAYKVHVHVNEIRSNLFSLKLRFFIVMHKCIPRAGLRTSLIPLIATVFLPPVSWSQRRIIKDRHFYCRTCTSYQHQRTPAIEEGKAQSRGWSTARLTTKDSMLGIP